MISGVVVTVVLVVARVRISAGRIRGGVVVVGRLVGWLVVVVVVERRCTTDEMEVWSEEASSRLG